MKAYLIGIVDSEALSPRGSYWPDDYVIPTLIRCSNVIASSRATMINQVPEVVGIKIATYKPYALKCRQAVPVHVETDKGW